jgi:hypothetical protein
MKKYSDLKIPVCDLKIYFNNIFTPFKQFNQYESSVFFGNESTSFDDKLSTYNQQISRDLNCHDILMLHLLTSVSTLITSFYHFV